MATFRNIKLKNGIEGCFIINKDRRIQISKTTTKAMFPDAETIAEGSTGCIKRRQKQI